MLAEQLMRYPVHHHGEDPRVTEHDFIVTLGGRIAVKGSPNIGGQDVAHGRDGLQKVEGLFVPQFHTLHTGLIVP